MKIMSFNTQHCLNYVTREIDFPKMAEAILHCGADIVGLNEMHGEGVHFEYTDQTKTLSELTGLSHYYFAEATVICDDDTGAEEGSFGNSILSKYPIIKAETIPIPDPVNPCGNELYETRCLLKVKLKNGITVLVTHFGLNHDEHLNAVKVVLENLEPENCILMGDFNVEPQDGVINPIRDVMLDTAEIFCPDLLSFPSIDPLKKIDYIFVSTDLKDKLIFADIPDIVAADHRPHICEINFKINNL